MKYKFPLFCLHDDAGNNLYTNDVIGKVITISNIKLEDYCKYYDFDCDIIRGYKWIDNKDFKVRDIIKYLYDTRTKFKKEGNPIKQIFKLIMNSAYGKTYQKPILFDKKYLKQKTSHYLTEKELKSLDKGTDLFHGHVLETRNGKLCYVDYPLNKFMIKNSAKIINSTKLYKNMYEVKIAKSIYQYANNNLFGVTILDMSKRIMNEVMTLAEELDIKIFYQDTDSMHIEKKRLDDLVTAYKTKYGRDLIGANLGQFHSDFDELTGDVYATKSIFLGKKAYIDMLENDKGEHSVHYRMKGIPLKCVKYHALQNYTDISIDSYKSMSKDDKKKIKMEALWK